MSLRSSLGLVRGLGSARSGTHHWWMQRLTAVALIPLSLWFVSAVPEPQSWVHNLISKQR